MFVLCILAKFMFITGDIMAWLNENEDQPKNHEQVPPTPQPTIEHSEASQGLETMRNLIVEIQTYKENNE